MSTDFDSGTQEETTDTDENFASPTRRFIRQFAENRLAFFGLVLLGFLLIVTLLADFIAPYTATQQNSDAVLVGPSLEYPMGTDELGRDIFSRILFGYRIIFSITLGGVAGAFVIGTTIGTAAGYYGGWIDELLMRGVDMLMSFPSLILALTVVAIIGPSSWGVALALCVAYTPIFARVSRSESVSLSNEEFVRGLQVRGMSTRRILTLHIVPNMMGPLTVILTLQLAFGILTTATLSFLGVGIQPPHPSLGVMVSDGSAYLASSWWQSIFPGIAIMLPVIAFNTIGDGLRDTFDPKEARA